MDRVRGDGLQIGQGLLELQRRADKHFQLHKPFHPGIHVSLRQYQTPLEMGLGVLDFLFCQGLRKQTGQLSVYTL